MPLYEYECKQCRQRVEKIQSFHAPPETVCPKCGGPLERVISAPAFQFKGTGWYVSDYAKSGTKKADGDGTQTKNDPPPEAGKETKTESGEKQSSSGPANTDPVAKVSPGGKDTIGTKSSA